MFLVLTAISLCAQPAAVQTSTCKHLTRTAQVTTGYHNVANATCPHITFSVAGNEFSTPDECPLGFGYYDGTVYSCSPGGAFIHCQPEGYKVNIVTCQGGGCPSIVGLTPGSWTSWEDVPAALAQAMNCTPPQCVRTFDWSAQVSACAEEPPDPEEPSGQSYEGGSGDIYQLVPKDRIAETSWPGVSPFFTSYEAAQTGGSDLLPVALRDVYGSYAPVPAVAFKADVTIEHFDIEGVCTNRRSFGLVGTVQEDGRFNVVESESVLIGDDRDTLTTQLRFDGATLFVVGTAAETGNAFTSTYPRFASTFKMHCFPLRPIFDWVRDPLRMPLFTAHTYRTVDQAEGQAFQRMVPWGSEERISEEHHVVGPAGSLRLVRWRCFDQVGRVRGVLKFDDHRQLAPGVWRPWHVVDTLYPDGGVTQQRVVTTLRMNRASVPTGPELDGPQIPEDDRLFQLWQ